jgi:hypothetical protein
MPQAVSEWPRRRASRTVPTLTVAAVWPTILNRARCVNTLYQGVEKRMGSFPLSFELMLLWLTA